MSGKLETASTQQQQGKQHLSAIGASVIQALGRPRDLLSVQVRQVWEGHFRVNVFAGIDAASTRIADSFFLKVDGDGKILASSPKIGKRY